MYCKLCGYFKVLFVLLLKCLSWFIDKEPCLDAIQDETTLPNFFTLLSSPEAGGPRVEGLGFRAWEFETVYRSIYRDIWNGYGRLNTTASRQVKVERNLWSFRHMLNIAGIFQSLCETLPDTIILWFSFRRCRRSRCLREPAFSACGTLPCVQQDKWIEVPGYVEQVCFVGTRHISLAQGMITALSVAGT